MIKHLEWRSIQTFGKTLTNQNSIPEEAKGRMQSGNACYHLVQSFFFQFAIQNIKINIYRSVILPFVLYGCETWSLTLREERRLRVFENRMLRKIFGPKRNKKTGEWSRLHNEELYDLYSTPNIIRIIRSRMR
jgi:hypothetical protein